MSPAAIPPAIRLEPVRRPQDDAVLEEFLTSSRFPFHGNPSPTPSQVRASIERGDVDPPANRAFWILASDTRV